MSALAAAGELREGVQSPGCDPAPECVPTASCAHSGESDHRRV